MKQQIQSTFRAFKFALLLALGTPLIARAATTTLTFDEFSNGTPLTTQYQSLGVTASGATILLAAFGPFPTASGANIAAAQTGFMTFSFDPVITGSIATVSAYLSGDAGTGIYAYDSNGFLVGQSLLPVGAPYNTLLSVSSSGAPIAMVTIHDGGGSFGVDNFSFTQVVSAPTCPQLAQNLYDGVVTLPNSDFKSRRVSVKRAQLKNEIADLQNLLSVNSSPSQQLYELKEIKEDLNDWIKPGTNRTNLLNLIDQLIANINAGHC